MHFEKNGDGIVSFRLRNQKNSALTLTLSAQAWFGVLELAQAYDWNPMGTISSDLVNAHAIPGEEDPWGWDYTPEETRLVLLEDALNLADALQRAYHDEEPGEAWYSAGFFMQSLAAPPDEFQPAIGVIQQTLAFCRQGAFLIERN
jgi:hypothetical protein